jgi:hypothetical protein
MLSYEEYRKLFESMNLSKEPKEKVEEVIKPTDKTEESEPEDDIKSDLVGTLGLIPPSIASKPHPELQPVKGPFSSDIPPIPTAEQAKAQTAKTFIAAGKSYKSNGVAQWSQYRKINFPAYKEANPTGTLHTFNTHASKQWKTLTADQKAQAFTQPGLYFNPQ